MVLLWVLLSHCCGIVLRHSCGIVAVLPGTLFVHIKTHYVVIERYKILIYIELV